MNTIGTGEERSRWGLSYQSTVESRLQCVYTRARTLSSHRMLLTLLHRYHAIHITVGICLIRLLVAFDITLDSRDGGGIRESQVR